MRFNYKPDKDFVLDNETALNKDLRTLVKSNKVLFIDYEHEYEYNV